jgi:DNA-binding CsgD family transcriptional regulator
LRFRGPERTFSDAADAIPEAGKVLASHLAPAQQEIRFVASLPLSLMSECLLARIRSLNAGVEYAAAPGGMSEFEIDAARLVALGLSDDEIAAALGISPSTAHHHVESARKRLHARNRAHMAALCVSLGIASAA